MTDDVIPATSLAVPATVETLGVQPAPAATRTTLPPPPTTPRLRRFVVAVSAGLFVALVPYLAILWDVWDGPPRPFRRTFPGNNFYDLQARAMFHGHLWVPTGKLGIEGFVHGGRTYTYFGIFPSLIRMPILLLTSRYDGHLTAPSMLVAWLVAGVFSALLLWRVRVLVRGPAVLGWPEAASYGLLVAAMMGGSILVYLASDAWVYHEDLVWSVALTVGSLFALLGVMERPGWWRVLGAGLLVLACSLNRLSTGYACIAGAFLVAVWFGLGRGGADRRRWALPTAGVGLVALVATCAVNMAKFGVPFGLPLADQVFTTVNAHRRAFLKANGGKGYSLKFLPTTALAYLQPFGIRFTPVFPFVTLPAEPARVVGGVVLDRANRTASAPASMPLLFLLSCWGVVACFRRRALGRAHLARIVVVTGALGCGVVLVWGWVADRYLADFLPLLIVASAVGLVDLWGRAGRWRPAVRRGAVAALVFLTVFSIGENFAVASTPQDTWSHSRVVTYVERQVAISNFTGHPITENVMRGSSLPYYAPADRLFIVGDCKALYLSNGENYETVPLQQSQHRTWMPIERPMIFDHKFRVRFTASPAEMTKPYPLLAVGSETIVMEPAGGRAVKFVLEGTRQPTTVHAIGVRIGRRYKVTVITDPYLHDVTVTMRTQTALNASMPDTQHILVPNNPSTSSAALPFTVVPKRVHQNQHPQLCRSILRQSAR